MLEDWMEDANQILTNDKRDAIVLHALEREAWLRLLPSLPGTVKAFARSQRFDAAPLTVLPVAGISGVIASYYVGAPPDGADAFALGSIVSRLPQGHYRFSKPQSDLTSLGWCLEQYRYDPFRPTKKPISTLALPDRRVSEHVVRQANAAFLVRDLVNTPANIMGPDALEAAALRLARKYKASVKCISGRGLQSGFPLIHAVGAASSQKPRLVDMAWGRKTDPKVTLVGKGVSFDTGGLDIKPSSNMLLMKKDMGGAATVLGLAQMIMSAKLRVRLRVLLPIVENAIAGNAFRPGDVFKSRKGLTVEIGNTDAEGRLILADALALADEESPDLLVDMATLTGAARVALGPDLPPFYTDDDDLAARIMKHGMAQNDPLWRMPLWKPYSAMIETPIADLNNSGAAGFAGSITAALFLRRFVEKAKHHVHFDIFAWTPIARPGRPKGGEAQGLRALYTLIADQFQK
jgi:leucyl aminopeptidase